MDTARIPVLPLDRPFTTAMARDLGISRHRLDRWVADGVMKHPLRGVFHSADLVDDLELRLAILGLVVPPDCVVTDRTAGWLWGANMILAPNDHLQVPSVHVFSPPGYRLRNGLVASGERMLGASDVASLDGMRVTTPLRTACDLGRLLHKDQALAAMDSLCQLGAFDVSRLLLELPRYKGYRGVIQLRALAPLVDPGAESPPESVLRLRWIEAGLPRPQCQFPVLSPSGTTWRLDLGLARPKFAAEYDGEAFHTDAEAGHDRERREYLRDAERWTIVVVRQQNLFGRDRDVETLLRQGYQQALDALK
jgi:hypothetical protein